MATPPVYTRSARATTLLLLIAAVVVTIVGVLTMLGWVLDERALTAWKAGNVPMAPATAVLFVMWGAALALRARPSAGRRAMRLATSLGWAGAAASVALLALRLSNTYWPAELLGLRLSGTSGDLTTGFISPITASGVLLANVTLLIARLSGAPGPVRIRIAVGFSGVITVTGFVMLLTALFGPPALVRGGILPVALNSSLVLLIMGYALLVLTSRPRVEKRASPRGIWQGRRVFAAIFALVAAATIAGGYAYYRLEEQLLRRKAEHELDTVSQLKVSQVHEWHRERLADGDLLAGNGSISRLTRRLLTQPDDQGARRDLGQWLDINQAHVQADRLFVIDANGVAIAVIPAGAEPAPGAVSRAAAEVLRTGKVTLLDFYFDQRDNNAYLATLVPVLDDTDANRPVGVLAMRIDPEKFLSPFIRRWPGTSVTAETLLARRDGNDVLYLNALRFDADAALRRRVPLTSSQVLAVKAALGQTGTVEGLDYRGASVLGVLRSVPDSPWLLVTRMDLAELHAALWDRLRLVAAFVGVVLFAAGSGLGLLWRNQSTHYFRDQARLSIALRESEERLRLALSGAAQGLWDLNVPTGDEVVSPEYATMLGYDPAAFHETHAAWVARLHPDDIERVTALHQDYVDGRRPDYRLEFRQRTRDGGWKWILSQATLVSRSEDGRPLRMLGTHTDITERKTAELRSQRLAQLYAALSQCSQAIVRCNSEGELFPEVCRVAVTFGGVAMAWVGLTDDARRALKPAAAFGSGVESLDGMDLSVDAGEPSGRGPVGIAIRENRPVWVMDLPHDATTAEWHDRATIHGWAAAGVLPLYRSGACVGALTVYTRSADMFDDDGRTLLREMARDISVALDHFARDQARAQAQEALGQSEQRYRGYIETATDSVFELTPEGVITFVSPNWLDLMGEPVAEAIGKPFERYIHLDDVPRCREYLEQTLAGGAPPASVEYRTLHRDGSVRWHSARGAPLRDRDGRLVGGMGIARDVTAWKDAEMRAAQAKERLELATRAAGIGTWDWDILTNEVVWDDRMFQLYGLQPHAVRVDYDTWLARVHPDDRMRVDNDARQALPGTRAYVSEFRTVWPDGTVRNIAAIGQVATDAQGQPVRMHGVNYDVTDRLRTEEALHTLVHEKEALLKEVHHRVKNNLQVIVSLLRLEAGRTGHPAVTVALREMQNRVHSMALLHESMYRSSNLDRVDLSVYLGRVCTQLFNAVANRTGAVTLRLDMDSVYVGMQQAIPCGLLINELVSNSLKHGFPEGRSGQVTVALHRMDAGPRLLLRVSDTGVGLPSVLDQRNMATVGLQLVKDLARQLQGTLEIGRGPGAIFGLVFEPATAHSEPR